MKEEKIKELRETVKLIQKGCIMTCERCACFNIETKTCILTSIKKSLNIKN